MKRRPALIIVALALLAGPLASNASGQQRTPPAPDAAPGDGAIPQAEVADLSTPLYTPAPFEVPGFVFPPLSHDILVAIQEDDQALKFDVGNELGGFASAPPGGSAFFGQGRPIFGLGAPPILASKSLRPLGADGATERFLGTPPVIPDATVIPKLGETPDQTRESFAFINGPPPLVAPADDTDVFPLPQTVAADTNGALPDNVDTPPTTPVGPEGPTTGTTTPSLTPTTAPPTGTTLPNVTVPTTPTTSQRPTTTTTPPEPSTTTTSPPRTTITTPPTTRPTTPPVTVPPTTTTTTIPPAPPPTFSFVLGNQREQATVCMAAHGGANNPADCDRLFDVDNLRPGQPSVVNLTLWNVQDLSTVDADELRLHASGPCIGGTNGPPPHGTGNLCDGIQLKVERYETAARSGAPMQCVYGCGNTFGGSLTSFAANHSSPASGIQIGNGFAVNEKAYLVVTMILPDTGTTSDGNGNDNRYLARTAAIGFTWQMFAG